MNFSPMIELTRNGISECLHLGALAVTDTQGHVVAQVGNPHWLCFTRSTLKALQALPLIQSGGAQQLGLTPQELAVMYFAKEWQYLRTIALRLSRALSL
jgi:L-asparaginase II